MQHTAEREQSCLLLARSTPRCAANAYVDFLTIVMANHVRLGRTLRNGDDRHPVLTVDLNFFVERQDHRMHLPSEYRVHDPVLQIVALNACNRSVVFYSQQDSSSPEIGQRHDLSRKPFRAQIVTLELHAGVLLIRNQLQKL